MKAESDARYAPLGDHLDIPGAAFNIIDSATHVAYGAFFGVYETAGRQYMMASLEALPADARITSVDFFVTHGAPGRTDVSLAEGNPATGLEGSIANASIELTVSPNVTKLTATPEGGGGYQPGPGEIPLLFWKPANTSSADVLWGARVHYDLP